MNINYSDFFLTLFRLFNISWILIDILPHCKEDPIYVFLELKLRGIVPNFDICERCIYSHEQYTYFAAAK